MSTLAAMSLALALMLAALPLTSLGATNDQPLLWWLGLAALLVGGLLPPATRFGLGDNDDD